ncbi:MAG: hypothetical protein MOGMAGMI_00111 [Candidatus Omnitrophica bacterium]|nr:hypothetical protein [Candidatus Omnitrophota bacterium]
MAAEWIECKLKDACSSVDYGLTAPAVDDSSGPRFLRITDIATKDIDWKSVPHVKTDADTIEKYLLHDGDIVLARTGASTGASAYIKNPPVAVFASYLVRLKAAPQFDSRFIAYFLKSNYFWDFIHSVLGDKSAQPNASASTMTQVRLRAPKSKTNQQAISKILASFDDKIELNYRMNETLEAMAQAIFKSWFVDFDPVHAKAEGRDPGLPKHIADLFPSSFEDSELGEIPTGWIAGKLNDITELQNGYAFSSADWLEYGVPVVKIGSVKPGIVDLSQVSYVSEQVASDLSRFRLQAGDLLIGMTGYVGEVGLVPHTSNSPLLNQRVGRFILKERGTAALAFVYCYARQNQFKSLVESKSHGTAQANVSAEGILSIPLVIPKESLRDAFNNLCRPLFDRLLANHAESNTLSLLRDSLLPKLISGEIKVSGAIN